MFKSSLTLSAKRTLRKIEFDRVKSILSQMTTYTIECGDPWFSWIQAGNKVVEGRKNSPKWMGLKSGDTLIFVDLITQSAQPRTFSAQVVDVTLYEAGPGVLRKYLETEMLSRVLPGVATIEEGEKIYQQWWSREQYEKLGILAIQVKVD